LGLAFLRDRGFEVQWDRAGLDTWRYLAGPDERRLAELGAALTDPDVRCIWVARGGYGAMRLLADLPWADVPSPRWLVGFSDVTAIHAGWMAVGPRTGVVHGPNVTTLGTVGGTDRAQVFDLLCGALPPEALGVQGLRMIRPGVAQGPVVGGNLSLVSRLIGTPWATQLEGSVLFLEDVGERPYRLDRMLTHLELCGAADSVAAVVLGEFLGCEESDGDYCALDVLEERLLRWEVPVLAGFPAGHGVRCRALPLGVTVRVEEGRLDVLQAPWAQ
jgi:muramoyltetrapeptide carboxypeptidase